MNTSSSAINFDEICKLTQVNINMIFFLRWQCISSSFPPAVIYGIQKEITDLAKCLRLRNHCHINIEKYCLHRKIFLFLFFSNILSSLSHVFFKQYDVKLLSQILGFGSCTFFFGGWIFLFPKGENPSHHNSSSCLPLSCSWLSH